jgi:hypothetical protein
MFLTFVELLSFIINSEFKFEIAFVLPKVFFKLLKGLTGVFYWLYALFMCGNIPELLHIACQ